MKIYKNIKEIYENQTLRKYFCGNFENVLNEKVVNELFFEKIGAFLCTNEEKNEFVFAFDIGKCYLEGKNLLNIFDKKLTKKLKKLEAYAKKEIYSVVPTTFVCLTNLSFSAWNEENSLVKSILDAYPCYNLFLLTNEDVSEEDIEKSNENRKYYILTNDNQNKELVYYDSISKLDLSDVFCSYSIFRFPELLKIYDDYRTKNIPLILPFNNVLADKPEFKNKGEEITLFGFVREDDAHFKSCLGAKTKALIYKSVDFRTFYDLEISMNLLKVFEGIRPITTSEQTYQALFFYAFDSSSENRYDVSNLRNSTNKMIFEDKMVSDIYSVIPIRYENINILRKRQNKENNFIVNNVITGLAFQDNFEFGNDSGNIVNNSERIERFDLGEIKMEVTEESHYNYYKKTRMEINTTKPINLRLLATVDKETHTGVLMLLNLGVKFRPTNYLNEVSCNRISMEFDENDKYQEGIKYALSTNGKKLVNMYKYLERKFEIERSGPAKHLILSPFISDFENLDKNSLAFNTLKQLKSSLLYAETMNDYGEELGKIIDNSLEETFKSKFGDSVYDYSVTNISNIGMLNYSDTYKDYLVERIDFAVVNLFYLELTQLEESAISNANMNISNFIKSYKLKDKSIKSSTKTKNTSSKFVLEKLEEIQEEYTKTLDFWSSQTNYYSSNVILNRIRKKFEIDKNVQSLKRNHKEIQQIYDNRQQSASGKSGLVLSIAGIILTVLNVLEIYTNAVNDPQEEKFLTFFEKLLFANVSTINVVRFALIVVVIYYSIKFIARNSFRRRND